MNPSTICKNAYRNSNVIHCCCLFFQSDPLNDVLQSKNGDKKTAEGKIKLNVQENGNVFNKYFINKVTQMSKMCSRLLHQMHFQ